MIDDHVISDDVSLSQSAPGESARRAVTEENVMTVTLVMVPVPVTQVLRVWPASCVVMDSMEPPVKVNCSDSFLFHVCRFHHPDTFLRLFSACNCSEHGSCDAGRKGTGSCFCDAGWTGERCESQQGEFRMTLFLLCQHQQYLPGSFFFDEECVCVCVCVCVRVCPQLKSSTVLRPVLQKPSVGRTTPVCVGRFMKEMDSPVQVEILHIQHTNMDVPHR